MIVALPGLFSYLFFFNIVQASVKSRSSSVIVDGSGKGMTWYVMPQCS